ncbi:TetR/AcrR family transcriptional regulator [Microbacterium sp. YY-01]|uniref:TetR/AcrR family transcriptional regulator n=1 Tax=Microbacterium sp. YY-01 TaxID=3421634 RepID=UPI003D17B769
MSSHLRERKRDAILDAARTVFFSNGYLGTSMDAIAAAATVSKQTVYNHFGDKRSLFEQLLARDMGQSDHTVQTLVDQVDAAAPLQSQLVQIAHVYLRSVLQPHLLRLRRLVIGEAERFPELAVAWHKNGPEQAYAMFSQLFSRLIDHGVLRIDDVNAAAEQFNWLILSVPLNRAMAYVDEPMPPADAEIDTIVQSAVLVFLAAYSTSHSASRGTNSRQT